MVFLRLNVQLRFFACGARAYAKLNVFANGDTQHACYVFATLQPQRAASFHYASAFAQRGANFAVILNICKDC